MKNSSTVALNEKDINTAHEIIGHAYRVGNLTASLGLIFGFDPVVAFYAGFLHDIGKICIDSDILFKPTPLTAEEWDIMRKHPSRGAEILSKAKFFPNETINSCLYHHERLDGTGYPYGIDDIPLIARIVAVCDVFDAMKSNRIYRPPCSNHEIARTLSSPGFDQMIVKNFWKVIQKGEVKCLY